MSKQRSYHLDSVTVTAARERAEAEADDCALLELRDIEVAVADLPSVIDGTRRARLLAADPISTTWEGWDLTHGNRIVLRCIRSRWRRDPVMLRRMAKADARSNNAGRPVVMLQWRPNGDWPHLRTAALGVPIDERLPMDHPIDPVLIAQVVGGVLAGLVAIHRHGWVHGGDLGGSVLLTDRGVRFLWMDAFGVTADPREDLMALGQLVRKMDPEGSNPISLTAGGWAELPPLAAEDGVVLLQRSMAGVLVDQRHRLAMAARNTGRRRKVARLARAIRDLSVVLPPPASRSCLKVGTDDLLVVVHSDGQVIRGGEMMAAEGMFDSDTEAGESSLPLVYSPTSGLNVAASRFLLRSWALRTNGDQARRQEIQKILNGDDARAEALVRWLAGMGRLRAARMLLQAAKTGSAVTATRPM